MIFLSVKEREGGRGQQIKEGGVHTSMMMRCITRTLYPDWHLPLPLLCTYYLLPDVR